MPKHFHYTLLTLLTLMTTTSHAQGKLDLQLGAFTAHQGTSQTIAIADLIGDQFTVTSHNDQDVLLGLGYFLDGYENSRVLLRYGINAFYLADTTVKGNVIQEMLFENLSYKYHVTHTPVYLTLKSIFAINQQPYKITFDIGVGPNFFKTSNVEESSLDGGITLPDSIFNGTTTVTTSAMIGIGIKSNQYECGYRFFSLGKGKFDKANSQVSSSFTTGNSYANALLCSYEI
jgi:hypothetical protein